MTAIELGRIVRLQRRESALRQDELAALAGVGTRFVSELENGKPSLELGKVVRVLETVGLEISVTKRRADWPSYHAKS